MMAGSAACNHAGVSTTRATTPPAVEQDLLDRARNGDEGAFNSLVETHRGELHAHCYRMLGSVHDAEDALQDALLRAWRGLPRFEGRSSVRSWLYKIATNASLDMIARRPKRVLPMDHVPPTDPNAGPAEPLGVPLIESVWVEPYPDDTLGVEDGYATPEATYDQRESVELAFIAAMQHLSPNQRAALLMRDVLGFSAQEVADSLDSTPQSVNSALQRARKTVEERLPEQSQQETLRTLGDQRTREIVEGYMDAMRRGDVQAVVGMLAEDAEWSMPPIASWFRGHPDLQGFLENGPLSGEWRWKHMPARVNGQLAVGSYAWKADEGAYVGFALDVLTIEGDRIAGVTSFINRSTDSDDPEFFAKWPRQAIDPDSASAFERFGLPPRLD
jgi:RNA polymerase sigma-70 factor, ECF subfamily